MPENAQKTEENPAIAAAMAALALTLLCLLSASGLFQGWLGQADLAAAPEASSLVWGLGLALSVLALAWWRGWAKAWQDPVFLGRFGLIAFGVLSLGLILNQRLIRIDGRLFAWIEDDALVSMQHAKLWVQGQGLAWASGPKVQGFSDPLWTLLMGGACALLPRDLAPLAMLLLNAALGLLGMLALRRLALNLGASPLAAALAMLGLGLSYEWVYAVLSGMETVAVAAISAVAMADLAWARRRDRPVPWRVFALAGALGLLRFDGLLPAAVLLALAWNRLDGAGRRRALLWSFGPWMLWAAFSAGYYGDWMPNTVRLKSGAWPGRWSAGFFYVLRTAYHAKIAWALGLAAWTVKGLRRWALALALLLGYGLLTGGDFYPGTRYLAAAWPLLWALPAAALSQRLRPALASAAMALALVLSYHAFWAFPGLMNGGWAESRDRIKVAMALDQRVRPGEKVAAAWAGAFYYYSSVDGVDLLGKSDRAVASGAPDPSIPMTAHNKMDLAHSLGGLKPAWMVLIPPGLPWPDPWLHAPYHDRVWADPLFQAHCKAEPGALAGPWVLCHCDWAATGHP